MSFLQDLEVTLSQGSAESRERALWYATDLLMAGRYTDNEIWVFGEIIGRLEEDIKAATRAQLARRLARIDHAPLKIINKLAFDDTIEVAGPILRQSERLDSKTLVANIRSKSQQHLLAISQRKLISVDVTDELLTRGNGEVVRSVARNDGARLSDFGILHMVKRSKDDSILIEQLGHRKDIPRHIFQQLIAKASENAKKQLERERPEAASQMNGLVTDVTGVMHSKFGPASKNYFDAKREVAKQHRHGNLTENKILEYAHSQKVEEVTVGLALLCSLPVDVVERVMVDRNRELMLIVIRTLGFSWETATALLFLNAPDRRIFASDLENMKREFSGLNIETCQSVLKAYRSRKQDVSADSRGLRLPQLHAS